MSCRSIVPLLEPFVDGELSPERVLEVEQHLAECSWCVERVRLGEAMRLSLRSVVRGAAQPSEAFRARLAATLEATRQREWDAQAEISRLERHRMLPWRTILPVAAAATLMLVWASRINNGEQPTSNRGQPLATAGMDSAGIDATIEDLLRHHVLGRATPVSPDLNLARDMEQEVGVPVRLPFMTQYGARWEGGRVVPVSSLRVRAASLRYQVAGHPVTLYVYDSKRVPLSKALQARWVGDEEVYVGRRGNYSIGAAEHNRVGYAVATDLSDSETAELLATLH